MPPSTVFHSSGVSAGGAVCTPHATCPFRMAVPGGQPVHAARLGQRQRSAVHGIAAAAPRARAAVGPVQEEVVDAIAVLERPGAVPNTHFEQHDQALAQLQQLVDFNSELGQAIDDAELVLDITSWDTLTLPRDVKQEFLGVYRESRKNEQAAEKEERRRRAEQRQQQREARIAAQAVEPQAAAVQQPSAADQAFEAQLHQQQQQQPQATGLGAQPSSQPLPRQRQRAVAQQPLAQPTQQQPPQRTRRSRSSAAAAPAAISSSVLSSLAASIPAPSSSSTGSSSTSRRSRAAAPTPSKPAAAGAAAASAAPVAAAPVPRARAAAATPSALSAHSSSSGSSALAAPVVQQQQRSSSFAPLPVLQQQHLAAPVRSASSGVASSRRLARAAGVSRRGAAAAGAVATASAAPSTAGGKLADNTIFGLDMRAELLTGEQERELAVMVQDLLALEAVAKELAAQLNRTPTELEWMEAAGAQGEEEDEAAALTSFKARLHAGRSAKSVMIKANYKLVVSICRKYQGHGMNMGDLINEGIAGLVKGVERFEPAKGFKFSTYAHWWIRQSVSRSLAEQGRLVRLPIHMQELLSKASKASKAFEAKHGREPTAEELAPELGVEASRIKDAWEAVTTPRSLDQPMGDAEGGTLGDVVEDERTIGSEEAVYIESLKQDLEGVLSGLSKRDAGVLRMRFGLTDGREYTLDEVGAEFKVTRERIRQIEAKAIRQLRAHHISPGSVMADYQLGPMADKQLASRTSSGTKKQK